MSNRSKAVKGLGERQAREIYIGIRERALCGDLFKHFSNVFSNCTFPGLYSGASGDPRRCKLRMMDGNTMAGMSVNKR